MKKYKGQMFSDERYVLEVSKDAAVDLESLGVYYTYTEIIENMGLYLMEYTLSCPDLSDAHEVHQGIMEGLKSDGMNLAIYTEEVI